MDIIELTFDARGVGCGMSLGVDSFATLAEYGRHNSLPGYAITHLTYFNVGAHHGYDIRLGQSKLSSRQLYEGQLEKVRKFAKEYEYPLVVIDTNMSLFFHRFVGKSHFYITHTYRNIAAAIVMQKLFGRYYYSSAYNLDDFDIALNLGSAQYEKWLLPHLSTGSTEFYSANRAWSRFEKTKLISELPESYEYLTVCLVGVDNCGQCDKCRKTQMTINVLGDDILNKYSKSFDLELYTKQHRRKYFASIYPQLRRNGVYGGDMQDILNHAFETDFPHLPEPVLAKKFEVAATGQVGRGGIRLRRFPFLNAPIITILKAGTEVSMLGTYAKWTKVNIEDKNGFVWTAGVLRKGK